MKRGLISFGAAGLIGLAIFLFLNIGTWKAELDLEKKRGELLSLSDWKEIDRATEELWMKSRPPESSGPMDGCSIQKNEWPLQLAKLQPRRIVVFRDYVNITFFAGETSGLWIEWYSKDGNDKPSRSLWLVSGGARKNVFSE